VVVRLTGVDRSRAAWRRAGPVAFVVAALATGCAPVDAENALSVDVFSIAVGDCLDDRDVEAEVTRVSVVDCAEPHDSEVFAGAETAADEFPGAEALEAELSALCRGEAFREFIGMPFAHSEFVTMGYHPTAESWERGDRGLLCTVLAEHGQKLTGTLRGVAR